MSRIGHLLLAALAAGLTLPAQQPGWTIIGWRIAVQARSFQSTFFEAVDKTSAAGVKAIEGYAGQQVGAGIARNLDWNLADADVAAVRQKLRAAGVTMPTYYAPEFPADEAAVRKLFQFAKTLAVETIVSDPPAGQLALADKLANEFGVSVALHNGDPKSQMQALEGRGKRMGVCPDTGAWLKANIKPVDGLKLVKDRVLTLRLRDADRAGPQGRDLALGAGAAGLDAFLWEFYRTGIKPSALVIDVPPASDPSQAIKQSAAFLEKTTLAVLGDYIDDLSKGTPPRFQVTDAERQQIEAAVPAQAPARPKKPRKLLVVDMQAAYGGHRSLAYANVAMQAMARKTGAFEPVFNNDFANLRWEKLRQFDALYLNNTVGPIFNAQEVRDAIVRFVREGGGLGGHHGTGRASLDWTEFGEMLGSYCGAHAVSNEKVTLKVDDPASPLNAAFGGKSFEWTGEFFRFPTPPYTRDKLHVLLTIDAAKTDMKQYSCAGCVREDNDYAISWIRAYGKGKVFYSDLGHNPSDFWAAPVVQHFLAGIQYILGDLDADSTPSAALGARK
jgi:hypothetical protein